MFGKCLISLCGNLPDSSCQPLHFLDGLFKLALCRVALFLDPRQMIQRFRFRLGQCLNLGAQLGGFASVASFHRGEASQVLHDGLQATLTKLAATLFGQFVNAFIKLNV